MDISEAENLEEKLRSLSVQLQTECAIFERIVYKNKNQHRRSSYFQYLLKVRRDLRLLQSLKLEEILRSCFHVITGKKPKQKVHLLESLKWRKCDGGKHNFMERLLGAERLLSEMVEPMLRAATEISILLARSFFMGFSLMVLALLARLRVLVQQMLHDVVLVFNTVSSLSQKKQSVKIAEEGVEVFREYYPTNVEFPTLDCVWKTDKFVLVERMSKSDHERQDAALGDDLSRTSTVKYSSIESFLGDEDPGFEVVAADDASEGPESPCAVKEDRINLLASPSNENVKTPQVEDGEEMREGSDSARIPNSKAPAEGGLLAPSSSSQSSFSLKRKSDSNKVAFISVKRPASSSSNVTDINLKGAEEDTNDKKDSFFDLLTGGSLKDSLF
ncbi:hypothetical protein HS088_TW21G00111 [Tripterygium wilfordii]|uniref:Nucleolus and neural progenitor protein-like N-terminal domain-containing protein n=1 Tax=Tripterygium wilfordii TaxID=458696 RepID=A0A7J7C1H7_TRIWF|nr:uncharacterized protein LOC119988370 isoform X2 [Tripterygium wilfordii]KAF5727971.1 hypothetical protein HS088_TW21G00111 [Tripterygium wilfordii]